MQGLTIERDVHFATGRRTRKVIKDGSSPEANTVLVGRVPRISRLMALAIRFDRLIKAGEIADQADLARLGQVTRARVTQIMNLLLLAPEIQEAILFLPLTMRGHDPILEPMLRPIAAEPDWRQQRRLWKCLLADQKVELARDHSSDADVTEKSQKCSPGVIYMMHNMVAGILMERRRGVDCT